MLQRKRPCQTQGQNNGGQPWGNRTICMQLFAVSRTTKANQRNLNGGWQASTNAFALCLCQPSPLCLPSKNGPVFFFFLLIKHSSSSFPHCLMSWLRGVCRVKAWSQLHSQELKHVTDEPQHVCYGLALAVAKWQYRDTKTSIIFSFHLQGLKASECNSADGFGCTHLSHSATSNFKGVDRKQNMYYEVGGGGCRQWIIGCQLEKKKNSQNATYWEAAPARFALLSSIGGLAGRSGGGIWKATFLAVTHWPECMIRLHVNRAKNRDHSQL